MRGTRLSQACECRSCGDWLRECVSSGRASIAVPCVQRAFENVPRNPGRRLRAGGTKLARALPALLADPLVQAAREAVVRGDYATLLDLVGVVPLMLGDGAFSSNSSSSVDDGATLGMAPTEASSVARIAAVVRAHLGAVDAVQLPRTALALQDNREKRTSLSPGTVLKMEGGLRIHGSVGLWGRNETA